MTDSIAACEAAAHDGGLAPGLALALAVAGTPEPPGGVGALPAAAVPEGATVVPHRLAELEGVAFVRRPLQAAGPTASGPGSGPTASGAGTGPTTTCAATTAAGRPGDLDDPHDPDGSGDADSPGRPPLTALLGAVRAGLARRLLDDAVHHLSERAAEGEPLSRKQLVRGTVADVHTELEAVLRLLTVAGDRPAAVADAHDRITALDWEAAKLLGASGFLADGPARAGYVGWLVAESWLPRPTAASACREEDPS